MLPKNYRERVYADWLGKCIGVRLGVPVENWTAGEIARNLGEVRGFLPLPPGKLFQPEDDTALPLILARALEQYGPDVSPAQIGETHGFQSEGARGAALALRQVAGACGCPSPL